jgi:hypothetical protein
MLAAMDGDVRRVVALVCLTVVGGLAALMGTVGLRVQKREGSRRSGKPALHRSVVVMLDPLPAALVLLVALGATLAILWTAR